MIGHIQTLVVSGVLSVADAKVIYTKTTDIIEICDRATGVLNVKLY